MDLLENPIKGMNRILRKHNIQYFVYNFRVLGFPISATTILSPFGGLVVEGSGP